MIISKLSNCKINPISHKGEGIRWQYRVLCKLGNIEFARWDKIINTWRDKCPKSAMHGGIETILQGGLKVSPCTRCDKHVSTYLLSVIVIRR